MEDHPQCTKREDPGKSKRRCANNDRVCAGLFDGGFCDLPALLASIRKYPCQDALRKGERNGTVKSFAIRLRPLVASGLPCLRLEDCPARVRALITPMQPASGCNPNAAQERRIFRQRRQTSKRPGSSGLRARLEGIGFSSASPVFAG